MDSKRFQRVVESFDCLHCGAFNDNAGYRNHCRDCLWSKHVDVMPGDRSNDCGGALRPVFISLEGGVERVHHECERCGESRRVKTAADDNRERIIELSVRPLP